MVTNNINLTAVSESCFAGFVGKTGFIALMLIIFILFFPAMSQADGLFDFQMKLAKKGNAEAEYKVGEMYETGFGVKKDMNEAKNWITKSASQGHETAKFKLLYWDVEKNGVTKANKAEVEVLKAKANEGNPQAQFYLGKMHAHGIGMKKNSDKAISWLNKAALVGVLAAERELTTVREGKQRQDLAQQKAKRRAHADVNKQAQLEKQRQDLAQQKAKQRTHANEKKQAELEKARREQAQLEKRNKAVADARLAAEKKAGQQAKIVAQAEATARRREAQKQALLKKRAADEKKRIIQFEADPCSGKSARFLSTCR
jgi:hypothetical protein